MQTGNEKPIVVKHGSDKDLKRHTASTLRMLTPKTEKLSLLDEFAPLPLPPSEPEMPDTSPNAALVVSLQSYYGGLTETNSADPYAHLHANGAIRQRQLIQKRQWQRSQPLIMDDTAKAVLSV